MSNKHFRRDDMRPAGTWQHVLRPSRRTRQWRTLHWRTHPDASARAGPGSRRIADGHVHVNRHVAETGSAIDVDGCSHGVFTNRPGTLTSEFFVNLLDIGMEWKPTSDKEEEFELRDRPGGEVKWTGTRVDLVFGSRSQLCAHTGVRGQNDAQE